KKFRDSGVDVFWRCRCSGSAVDCGWGDKALAKRPADQSTTHRAPSRRSMHVGPDAGFYQSGIGAAPRHLVCREGKAPTFRKPIRIVGEKSPYHSLTGF